MPLDQMVLDTICISNLLFAFFFNIIIILDNMSLDLENMKALMDHLGKDLVMAQCIVHPSKGIWK